ncbi:MAG: ABC transporter permease subunit [Anaerolineae bacterium]|nr:ABC transporter permease [Anaerolineae bacterium]MDW8300181.1 ABC transporter permease subunit [Anaerolineae bacterium]
MKGVIFRETLRRSWRSAALVGLTMSAMALYVVGVLSDSHVVEMFSELVSGLPFLVNALGGGDAVFLATPAGMINYGYFSWLILVVCGYGVYLGVSATISEEDRGILDVLLSAPVTRTQLLIEKLLAFAFLIALGVIIGHIGLALVVTLFASMRDKVDQWQLVQGSLNMLPSAWLVLAFTAGISTIVRRRNVAATLGGALVGGSFFVDIFGRNVPDVNGLRAVSFLTYYDSVGVMKNGLALNNVLLLLGIAAAMVIISLISFQRRDIGV